MPSSVRQSLAALHRIQISSLSAHMTLKSALSLCRVSVAAESNELKKGARGRSATPRQLRQKRVRGLEASYHTKTWCRALHQEALTLQGTLS